MNPYKQLRRQIKSKHTGKCLGVIELSKKLGISSSCISKIERNINTPTLEIIVAYQRYFGIPYENLIEPLFHKFKLPPEKERNI